MCVCECVCVCVCAVRSSRVFGLRACVLTWLPASWLACVLLVVPLPARVCSFLPFAYYSVVADKRVACRIPTLRHYAHQHTCNAFSVVASSSGMSSSAAKDPSGCTSWAARQKPTWWRRDCCGRALLLRGHATGARYVLKGRMHDRIEKYANWNGQW